jgi:hypothetical protein
MSLWGRIIARRQAGLARAAALDDIDGVPLDGTLPPAPAQPTSPVMLWDRILARRLATQFPESGMNADQVTTPTSLFSPSFLPVSPPKPLPLLLQWYDTVNVPATPLIPSSEEDEDVSSCRGRAAV